MQLASFSFLLGILTCHSVFPVITLWWVGFIVLLFWVKPIARAPFIWFIIGFVWMMWHIQSILAQHLPDTLQNQPIIIIGQVIGFPHQTEKYQQLDFQISQLSFAGQLQNFQGRVRLYWQPSKKYPAATAPHFQPQQTWQLSVRLTSIHEELNFDGTDYSNILFQQRIRAKGRIESNSSPQLLAAAPYMQIDRWRYRLFHKIQELLPEHPFRGILIALTLGEGRGISTEQWQLFRQTGIIHLVVISGSHISLIALTTFLLVGRIWRYSGLTQQLPTPRVAAIASLLAALSYSLLAGFSIPTQRAMIMVAVVIGNKLFARHTSPSNLIATALFCVLIYDPLAVLATGFWLSFLAVIAITWVISGRRIPETGFARFKRDFLITQLAVFAVLLPPLLLYYGNFPINTLLTNSIAIPLFNVIIVPFSLLGAGFSLLLPELATYCFHIAAAILYYCLKILEFISHIAWTAKSLTPPTGITVSLASLGVLLLLLPRGFPARWLGAILILPIFFSPPNRPSHGEIWFTLFDVGQGLAAIVQTQHYTLIYDTGGTSGKITLAERVIIPYLQQQQIHHVDLLVISHADLDHSAGTMALQENVSVAQTMSSVSLKNSQLCRKGQHWNWDGVEFKILHPEETEGYNDNNQSCVLKIQTGEQGILLTGDIESLAEHFLTRYYPIDLQAEILVVPHHGSKTSSSEPFIRTVAPQYALISSGYRNPFKHPHSTVVQRYQAQGATILNTAETGAISFKISAQRIATPQLARVTERRYWHD